MYYKIYNVVINMELIYKKFTMAQKLLARLYDEKGNRNLQQISNCMRVTYAHLCHIKNEFVGDGLLTSTTMGRQKILELTPLGEKVGKRFSELIKLLK